MASIKLNKQVPTTSPMQQPPLIVNLPEPTASVPHCNQLFLSTAAPDVTNISVPMLSHVQHPSVLAEDVVVVSVFVSAEDVVVEPPLVPINLRHPANYDKLPTLVITVQHLL